ncbi:MAG TPA: hypothetical protein DCP28_19060 [Cytophagales bacterium]|nr:hypothetical protein [Cytophagales bacterium]
MEEVQHYLDPWYSSAWWSIERWKGFTFDYPFLLYLLIAVPLLFLLRFAIRHFTNQKLAVALVKGEAPKDATTWLRFLPDVLMALALALCIVALARPQITQERVEEYTEGIDIALVLDISESMRAEDFQPNRLEAAKETARQFIMGRKQDRIGLVIFAGDALSLSPLTTDYDLLNSFIDQIDFSLIPKGGTAIGSALGVATNRMRESEASSKVVILLSDGDNTAGNLDPITAANLAHAYEIKIYTIGIGREGMVTVGRDILGQPRRMPSSLDESTLREIAKIGEGQFYRVSNNAALEEVFSRIDAYERSEVMVTRYEDTRDYYHIPLTWAVLFLLVWMFTKSTLLTNVLQD